MKVNHLEETVSGPQRPDHHKGQSFYVCFGRNGGVGWSKDGAIRRLTLWRVSFGWAVIDLEVFWGDVNESVQQQVRAKQHRESITRQALHHLKEWASSRSIGPKSHISQAMRLLEGVLPEIPDGVKKIVAQKPSGEQLS